MKRIILVIQFLCFIPVSKSYGQVNITSKEFKFSYFNNTECDGYIYEGNIPILNDTIKFFSHLQDSIIGIYQNSFNRSEGMVSVPDFSNLTSNNSCLPDEQSTLDYEIYSNTKDLLSFNITSSWSAGGGGAGMGSKSYCFNIDLNQKKFITLESLFLPKKFNQVLISINQKIGKEVDYEVNHEDGYSPRYEGFTLTDSTLIINYIYTPTGSKQFYSTIEIPFTELRQYLIYRRKD